MSAWEAGVAAVWADESLGDEERIERMRALGPAAPHPSVALFELASAHDAAGLEAEAEALYVQAVDAGLARADGTREAHRRIQHASTLRSLGRYDEAIAMLRDAADHPEVGAAREAFLALALHSAGRPDEALRVAIDALVPAIPLYRRALRGYAADLTG